MDAKQANRLVIEADSLLGNLDAAIGEAFFVGDNERMDRLRPIYDKAFDRWMRRYDARAMAEREWASDVEVF